MEVKQYDTAKQYLAATEAWLEEKELLNNFVLGHCRGLADQAEVIPGRYFVNVLEKDKVVATSIKTWVKVVVSGDPENTAAFNLLADFYKKREIPVKGVFGEASCAWEFAKHFGKSTRPVNDLLVHGLQRIEDLPLVPGEFRPTGMDDLDLLAAFFHEYEMEVNTFPKRSVEEMRKVAEGLTANGDVFVWTDQGNVVTMAAVLRRTRRLGIVGYVYTPPALRGRGFATSCVWKLTGHILSSGFDRCGLFTDAANPVSNKIYKNIGYEPVAKFSDIEFEE